MGLNWTSIRPVYIYGPLNYNPVERYLEKSLKSTGLGFRVQGSGFRVQGLGFRV